MNSIHPKRKIRVVLEGLRGEQAIAEPCRREQVAQSPYNAWSKEFLEAGKKRVSGDVAREATSHARVFGANTVLKLFDDGQVERFPAGLAEGRSPHARTRGRSD